MRAIFHRTTQHLENGATLLHWQLRTSEGTVIDASLANAPTVQDGKVYFVTAEDVAGLDTVEMVADLADIEHGKPMALYRIARESCVGSP